MMRAARDRSDCSQEAHQGDEMQKRVSKSLGAPLIAGSRTQIASAAGHHVRWMARAPIRMSRQFREAHGSTNGRSTTHASDEIAAPAAGRNRSCDIIWCYDDWLAQRLCGRGADRSKIRAGSSQTARRGLTDTALTGAVEPRGGNAQKRRVYPMRRSGARRLPSFGLGQWKVDSYLGLASSRASRC